MFTDEQLEEAQLIADGLLDGNPAVLRGLAEEVARMVEERDLDSIPGLMAVIVCLLPHAVQSRLRFGEN